MSLSPFKRSMPFTNTPSRFLTSRPTVVPPSGDVQYADGGNVYVKGLKVFTIFFGSFPCNTSNLTNYFVRNLGNTSWFSVLTNYYYENVAAGIPRKYFNGTVSLSGSVNYMPKATSLVVNDSYVRKKLLPTVFNKMNVQPDSNTLYAIIFNGNFTFTNELNKGRKWKYDWCGYHSGLYLVGRPDFYPYTVVGNPVDEVGKSGCSEYTSDTVNGDTGGDSLVSVLAHEIAETITDPIPRLSWTFNPSLAICRYSNPCEISDVCSWYYGSLPTGQRWNVVVGEKKFLVELIWQPGEISL
jgi:hypothetical protein